VSTTYTPAVPAEFVGLARQFLRDAAREHEAVRAMLERITAPVFTRLERHPGRNLRDGALRTLADACEALPHDFRLGFGTQLDPRGRRGKIIDLRVQPATLQSADWDDDALEPTLSVAMHWFDVPPRVDQTTSQCLAVVSLHALGRRYERGRDHSHAAIIADLQALATVNVNDAERFPEGERFQIPTPRGSWCGTAVGVGMAADVGGNAVRLVVRTFLD
jgi:hypothetical protein